MASSLRVSQILPSVGTNVAIGTDTGSVTISGTVTGVSTFSSISATNVNAITVNATSIVGVNTVGVVTAYVTSINEGQLQGYRNMLYNGAMVVNQRGFTSAASTSTGYSVDRWLYDHTSDSVVAVGQSTSAAAQPSGQGFTNSLHVRVTTADTSLAAGQYALLQQRLEGYDVQRIKKGSSNAEPVTLSFWVRSSKTGTYIIEAIDADNTRQCSKSYTIDSANTWEKKIVTFPADTTGAFDNDNALSLYFNWWLAAGSTFSGGTLNTSWAATTNANRAVGQVNFLDTIGAQFNITGCQLEVGPNATEFEFRSYGDELRMCQRYYERFDYTTAQYANIAVGFFNSTTEGIYYVNFNAVKRNLPSMKSSSFGSFRVNGPPSDATATSVSCSATTPYGFILTLGTSGRTYGNGTYANRENLISPCFIEASSEL